MFYDADGADGISMAFRRLWGDYERSSRFIGAVSLGLDTGWQTSVEFTERSIEEAVEEMLFDHGDGAGGNRLMDRSVILFSCPKKGSDIVRMAVCAECDDGIVTIGCPSRRGIGFSRFPDLINPLGSAGEGSGARLFRCIKNRIRGLDSVGRNRELDSIAMDIMKG